MQNYGESFHDGNFHKTLLICVEYQSTEMRFSLKGTFISIKLLVLLQEDI